MKTKEICLFAYRSNKYCFNWIPEEIREYATQPVGSFTKPARRY